MHSWATVVLMCHFPSGWHFGGGDDDDNGGDDDDGNGFCC